MKTKILQTPGSAVRRHVNDRPIQRSTSADWIQCTVRDGFTLMELLVVIATTGILVALVLPTLGFSKGKSQAENCLRNFGQLTRACAMYASDNQNFYPPNPDDGGAAGYTWCQGSSQGWSSLNTGGSADAGKISFLTNAASCLLAPYLSYSAVPFKCPGDPRLCRLSGIILPVARSCSANQGVGTVDPTYASSGSGHSGRPTLPVNGPWLNGSHNHKANSPYATFGKTTDFKNCSPGDIWIYADEDPWSINDASMVVVAAIPEIVDFPSARHQNAGGFGFCDGHTEMHRWKSKVFVLNSSPMTTQTPTGPARADWFWFSWHATRSFNTGTVP